MAFFDDVLDATGRTPRELGALHLFVERCVRTADGRAVLIVWAQAAFTPCRGTVRCGTSSWPLPPLGEGQVVRAELPLRLDAPTAAVEVTAESPVKDSAQRVRQAWKLTDTYAVTTTPTATMTRSLEATLALNVLTIPLGVAVLPSSQAVVGDTQQVHVERARELKSTITCEVVSGELEVVAEARWQVMWKPGDPLPAAHAGPLMTVAAVTDAPANPAVDSEVAAEGTSPWAFAKALIEAGFPLARVRERLVAEKGLSEADASLLLSDLQEPQAPTDQPDDGDDTVSRGGLSLGPALGLGTVCLAIILVIAAPSPVTAILGLILLPLGIWRSIATFGVPRQVPRVEAASLRALAADDSAIRCARHPTFASLGACGRCGAFCCRVCAPQLDFPRNDWCSSCAANPAARTELLAGDQRAAARAAAWQLGFFGLNTATLAMLDSAAALLIALGLLPLIVLAFVQRRSLGAWPSLLALALGLALQSVASLGLSRQGWGLLLLLTWPTWLVAGVVILTLASTLRSRARTVS